MKKIFLFQCLLVFIFTPFALASRASSGSRSNVTVIVVDDQRWDEYGEVGHPYLKTPNIDRLAKESVTFTSAYVASPLCSPNRESILTGRYISRHGVVDNLARNLFSKRLDLDLDMTIGSVSLDRGGRPIPSFTKMVPFIK